jgi:hypothetical protein
VTQSTSVTTQDIKLKHAVSKLLLRVPMLNISEYEGCILPSFNQGCVSTDHVLLTSSTPRYKKENLVSLATDRLRAFGRGESGKLIRQDVVRFRYRSDPAQRVLKSSSPVRHVQSSISWQSVIKH